MTTTALTDGNQRATTMTEIGREETGPGMDAAGSGMDTAGAGMGAAGPGMDAAEFRRIMGHFATGVVVVTTRDPVTGTPCGLTVSAFSSVSLEPLLVLVCIEKHADSHECIRRSGYFAVNILPFHGESLSRRFAGAEPLEKFKGVAFREERTGAPILEDAMGWLDCRVHAVHPAGDHTIFVGEVLAGDARADAPLIFFRGEYGRFAS